MFSWVSYLKLVGRQSFENKLLGNREGSQEYPKFIQLTWVVDLLMKFTLRWFIFCLKIYATTLEWLSYFGSFFFGSSPSLLFAIEYQRLQMVQVNETKWTFWNNQLRLCKIIVKSFFFRAYKSSSQKWEFRLVCRTERNSNSILPIANKVFSFSNNKCHKSNYKWTEYFSGKDLKECFLECNELKVLNGLKEAAHTALEKTRPTKYQIKGVKTTRNLLKWFLKKAPEKRLILKSWKRVCCCARLGKNARMKPPIRTYTANRNYCCDFHFQRYSVRAKCELWIQFVRVHNFRFSIISTIK